MGRNRDDQPAWFPIPVSAGAHTFPFGAAELALAAKRLSGGKTPGPDLIHNEVIRIFAREDSETLLTLFNLC